MAISVFAGHGPKAEVILLVLKGRALGPRLVCLNFFGAFRKPDLAVTTPQLEQMIRVDIAQQVMAQGPPGPV